MAHKLENKTYVCVSYEKPAAKEGDPVEVEDIGLLIDNDDVDWERFDGTRAAKVTFIETKEEKKKGFRFPFTKPKTEKIKVEKTMDATRHTKNADVILNNVNKQEIVDVANQTVNMQHESPIKVQVYHDVGSYDLDDLMEALVQREIIKGVNPDIYIMGYAKQVEGNNVVFTGEVITD